MNKTKTVQTEVTVTDFGFSGCYSQRAAEIRQSMETAWGSEVTVMVFGFFASYVQRIAMIRNQIFLCYS
jgi:hypothetical protein